MQSNTKAAGTYKNSSKQRFGGKSHTLPSKYKNFTDFAKKCDVEIHLLDLRHIDAMINNLSIDERRKTLIRYIEKRKYIQSECKNMIGGEGIARREANLWLLDLCAN